MNYITSKNIKQNCNTIITIGNFDGVHKGHLNLISELKRLQRDKYTDCETVVLSFFPHPKNFYSKDSFKVVFSSEERFSIFQKLNIDTLIEYPFDEVTKNTSAQSFIDDILIGELNCKALVVGEDYHFGKNKEGSAKFLHEVLTKIGIEVIIVKFVNYLDEKLSSTTIRDYLANGEIEKVNELLEKPYFLIGEVKHGKKLGRTIGFPTMNIYPDNSKLLPSNGVYISKVYIDEVEYKAVTNVGFNPTVDGDKLVVESHILGFEEDIYGKIAKVEFFKKTRSEKKFNSIDELKQQIDCDVMSLKEYFKD